MTKPLPRMRRGKFEEATTMKMTKQLVIFDLDGTILDTLEDLKESLNAALDAMGYPRRTLEEVRTFVGNGIRKLIERAVPAGTGEVQQQAAYDAFMAHYRVHCADHTKPYPGILPFLEELKARSYRLAVVSNKADGAVQILCGKYFPGIFDCAVGERPGIRKKPAPDAVFEVLERFQLPKDQALYIGDSEVDIETARQADMDCVLVSWGFRDRACLERSGAKHIVSDCREIWPFLGQ